MCTLHVYNISISKAGADLFSSRAGGKGLGSASHAGRPSHVGAGSPDRSILTPSRSSLRHS